MNKTLTDALALMARARKALVKSYTDENSIRFAYFYDYYKSPAKLNIAFSSLENQLIFYILQQAVSEINEKTLSRTGYNLFIQTIQKLYLKSDGLLNEYPELIKTKILSLEKLLIGTDKSDEYLQKLRLTQGRNKYEFEIELKKYSQEEENKNNH